VYDDPEDLRVIGGVQRSILNRTIHHIIASSPNGYGDPREITDFTEYAEYDKARVDNLYEQFGSEVDSAIVNDDNEQSAYSDETTRESVELLISELQTYLRQNAQATKQKKEYILTEEQEALVLDEAMRRIGLISQIELARVSSQQEVEARKTRAELGYSDVLQPEGIALDVEHIVMDSIQSVKKGISRSYEDRGRFMDVDGLLNTFLPNLIGRRER
jgi:hypothetical protein